MRMPFRVYAIILLWVFGPLPTQACPKPQPTVSAGCVELPQTADDSQEFVPERPGKPAARAATMPPPECQGDATCVDPGAAPGGDARSVKAYEVTPDGEIVPR